MKKILLPILALILAACAPQVTVTPQATVTLTPPPTATVLPTPTLHPQFIALQDQIAAAGERFTLNPDGTVQDGATTIPGLQVGNDGKITITVNGEPVEIDPSSMNFDDENGLSIEGFEDTDGDGDWEAAKLTPEEQLAVDLERWNLTSDKYNVDYDEEGKIELREKGTNKLVYWDGKWSDSVMIDLVVSTNTCMPTDFPEDPGTNLPPKNMKDAFMDFWGPFLTKIVITPEVNGLINTKMSKVFLGGSDNCWGELVYKDNGAITYLFWPDLEGNLQSLEYFDSNEHR